MTTKVILGEKGTHRVKEVKYIKVIGGAAKKRGAAEKVKRVASRSPHSRWDAVATPYLSLIKEFPLHTIRDDAHHAEALNVIDSLTARELSSEEESYLDVLTLLVERYEEEHHPIPDVSEAAMLRHLMESRRVSQTQLSRDTKLAASTVSELLSGAREMSKRHIVSLARYFHVSPAVFLPNATAE